MVVNEDPYGKKRHALFIPSLVRAKAENYRLYQVGCVFLFERKSSLELPCPTWYQAEPRFNPSLRNLYTMPPLSRGQARRQVSTLAGCSVRMPGVDKTSQGTVFVWKGGGNSAVAARTGQSWRSHTAASAPIHLKSQRLPGTYTIHISSHCTC